MNQPLSQSYRNCLGSFYWPTNSPLSLNHRNDCVTRYQSVNALWRNTAYSEDSIDTLQKQNAENRPCTSTGRRRRRRQLLLLLLLLLLLTETTTSLALLTLAVQHKQNTNYIIALSTGSRMYMLRRTGTHCLDKLMNFNLCLSSYHAVILVYLFKRAPVHIIVMNRRNRKCIHEQQFELWRQLIAGVNSGQGLLKSSAFNSCCRVCTRVHGVIFQNISYLQGKSIFTSVPCRTST